MPSSHPSSRIHCWGALALLLLGSLLLVACGGGNEPADPQQPSGLVFEDCQLGAPGLALRVSARCATLQVLEDPGNSAGRTIGLNLAVVPAISRSPEPDPVFFLAGGPGQAATETYPLLSTTFEQINQDRDIILVDQRGTGKSNPLDCTQEEEVLPENVEPDDEDYAQAVRACLDNLDADPKLYTTSIAMQDLDRVREALGYAQINLYGVSYGTRAALTYLQMFPDQVRTVTLDGVVPQDEPLGLSVAADAQRALDLIFERCAAESACRQAFPNLPQEFDQLLETLRSSPVEVSLLDPITGEPDTLTFTADHLGTAVRLMSYTPETAALLPLLIHTAAAQEDLSPLAAQYLIVVGDLETSITGGMHNSVICSEDVPFISPDAAEEQNAGTYLGNSQTDALADVCALWPHDPAPESFKQPVSSEKPVLLLSGEADPVTPPSNAAEVAETLPNSLSLVAPGQGHNVVYRGCFPRLLADFIESGSAAGLDASCVQEIRAAPFFVDFTGPMP